MLCTLGKSGQYIHNDKHLEISPLGPCGPVPGIDEEDETGDAQEEEQDACRSRALPVHSFTVDHYHGTYVGW